MQIHSIMLNKKDTGGIGSTFFLSAFLFTFSFFFDSEAENRDEAEDVSPLSPYSPSLGYKTPTSPWPNHTHPRYSKHYYASSHRKWCVQLLIKIKIKGYLFPYGVICDLVFIVVFLLLDVALAAVLVPVLVMVLTALILIAFCAWHWKNRYIFLNIFMIIQREERNHL